MAKQSTAKEKMIKARDLIKAGRYSEARAILVTVSHPLAQKWLLKLDEIEGVSFPADVPPSQMQMVPPPPPPLQAEIVPPPQTHHVVLEQKGPGCLKWLFGGIFGLGCGVPIAFCGGIILLIIIVAALIQQGEKAATNEAIDRNDGRGTLEEPIRAGEWAIFEDGEVQSTRMIQPADDVIKEFNRYNSDSSEGAEYVLIWFKIKCNKDRCYPPLDLDLHLVDSDGTKWKEPLFITLDDDLDRKDGVKGSTLEGWQAFEFPTSETIEGISIKWGGETLYQEVPSD
ncbi:MAG: hypothetical protein JXJ20_06320 [Anaerolineae bacterium]|nr:hypothetical protein [Anaerolineae bacterium]